jgi:hypothetical protein
MRRLGGDLVCPAGERGMQPKLDGIRIARVSLDRRRRIPQGPEDVLDDRFESLDQISVEQARPMAGNPDIDRQRRGTVLGTWRSAPGGAPDRLQGTTLFCR